ESNARAAGYHHGVKKRRMEVKRQALDQHARKEGAGKGDAADQQGDGYDFCSHHPSEPKGRELAEPDANGDDSVGRDDRRTLQSGSHQQRQQYDSGTDGTAGKGTPGDRRYHEAAV